MTVSRPYRLTICFPGSNPKPTARNNYPPDFDATVDSAITESRGRGQDVTGYDIQFQYETNSRGNDLRAFQYVTREQHYRLTRTTCGDTPRDLRYELVEMFTLPAHDTITEFTDCESRLSSTSEGHAAIVSLGDLPADVRSAISGVTPVNGVSLLGLRMTDLSGGNPVTSAGVLSDVQFQRLRDRVNREP